MRLLALVFLFAGSLILFCLNYLFQGLSYRKRCRESFSPLNHFPYELNEETSLRAFLTNNIALLFSIALMIAFFLLLAVSTAEVPLSLASVSAITVSVLFFILNRYDLAALKGHMVLASLEIVFSLMCPFAIIFSLIPSLKSIDISHTPYIIITVICSAVILFIAYLILNPKTLSWTYLEEKRNEDGSTSYQRPKLFFLPFAEFFTMLTLFIDMVSMIILYAY